jgi:spore maturation protein CgeB
MSSSWGNGHATLWRGLCSAWTRRGHEIVFFEKDVPYYASHRDLTEIPGGELTLYGDWQQVRERAERHLRDADVAMVTSYCPDGIAATQLVLGSASPLKVFYDLDTPVTLAAIRAGEPVSYIGQAGLSEFDLVLSYTGGSALTALQQELGARRVATLYGHVDPAVHQPVDKVPSYACDLSYLGTYARDRQPLVDELFVAPAELRPNCRFLVGGSMYPEGFPPVSNIRLDAHVPPPVHSAFYSSSRLTLNVTRKAMAEMGYCPSGRLFEAAACGTPLVSDYWQGLEEFFQPGEELLVCRDRHDVVAALELPEAELAQIARRARERTLDEHTSENRCRELERLFERALEQPPLASRGRNDAEEQTCGE